ncbi:MAG: hypothetical protein RR346_09615, partial [Bacteroidales bacterium]
IETLNKEALRADIQEINQLCENYLADSSDARSVNFLNFYQNKYAPQGLEELVVRYNIMLETASNSDDRNFLKKLSDSPVLYKMSFGSPANNKITGILLALFVPFSLPYYLFAIFKRKRRMDAIRTVIKNNRELLNLL